MKSSRRAKYTVHGNSNIKTIALALWVSICVIASVSGCGDSDNESEPGKTDLIGNYMLVKSSYVHNNAYTSSLENWPPTCSESDDAVWCVEITSKDSENRYRGTAKQAQHVFASWNSELELYEFDIDWFTGTSQGPKFFFSIDDNDTLSGYGCYSTSGDSDCYELDPSSKKFASGYWPE